MNCTITGWGSDGSIGSSRAVEDSIIWISNIVNI